MDLRRWTRNGDEIVTTADRGDGQPLIYNTEAYSLGKGVCHEDIDVDEIIRLLLSVPDEVLNLY